MITFDQAREQLLAAAIPITDSENIHLINALGRIISTNQNSQVTVPPMDNSAMDGYAIRIEDLGKPLPISQRVPAGSIPEPLTAGTAARIFTGAPVPEGADTVIKQEECSADNSQVTIETDQVTLGQNIRRAGEDLVKGDEVLQAGKTIRTPELGLAAAVGLAELPVLKKLKVATFTTGDELIEPGNELDSGQIYNANRYLVAGLLQQLGCELIDLGQVEDTLPATKQAMLQAAEQADLVVTSGGVSVGEEDHIKNAVTELGSLDLWRIAIKPGKPLAYGTISHENHNKDSSKTPFIGLPGNPVSAFVTFLLFAVPFIRKTQGASKTIPNSITATADFEWNKAGKRREFVRAKLDGDKVQLFPHQGSHLLTSTVWADGLVVIPEGNTVSIGDTVEYYSFNELLS